MFQAEKTACEKAQRHGRRLFKGIGMGGLGNPKVGNMEEEDFWSTCFALWGSPLIL